MATREQQGDGGWWIKTPLDLIDSNLSDGAFRLYLRLIAYKGEQGCFPSQETLASNLQRTDRAIRNLLYELRDAGLVRWKRRWIDGRQKAVYELVEGVEVTGRILPVSSVSDRKNSSAQLGERPEEFFQSDRKNSSGYLESVNKKDRKKDPSILPSIGTSETDGGRESTGLTDGWSPSQDTLTNLRKLLASGGGISLPSDDDARKVAAEFDSVEDMNLWQEIRFPRIPHSKAKGIGLYRADAKHWMAQKRRDVAAGNSDLYQPEPKPEPESPPVEVQKPTPAELRERSLRELARRRDRFPDTDERWSQWAEAERQGNAKAQIVMMTGRLFGYDAAVRMARAKFSPKGDVLVASGDIDEADLRDVLQCLEGEPFASFERSTRSLEAEAEPGSVPHLPKGVQASPARGRVLRMGERSA